MALAESILSQTCCFGDLKAAQEKLASLIGIPLQKLGEPVASYYELDRVEGVRVADSHPALQRLDATIETVRAQAALAKARDAADLTLGVGYRYEAATDVNTFVFSASMPLNFVKRGRAEQAATLLRVDALRAGARGNAAQATTGVIRCCGGLHRIKTGSGNDARPANPKGGEGV